MLELINLPLSAEVVQTYGGGTRLRRELSALGCQGIEGIWAGEDIPADFPRELVHGYHLTFFADWLDFFREDRTALLREFGSMEAIRAFYGGWGAEHLLAIYREDLGRAKALGVRYIVFHVSNVSITEGYTYRWRHCHREVVDAAAEIVNTLLAGEDGAFDFLLENQWWPGFTMTDPAITWRLLERVHYPRKGILLDTGHLMNTELSLHTQREGVAYIHQMLDRHGPLCEYIQGVHLHQSLSGGYVQNLLCQPAPDLPQTYMERFSQNYQHILRIDRHQPWTIPEVRTLVERINPRYLTHELASRNPAERRDAVLCQRNALGFTPGGTGASAPSPALPFA